MANCIYKDCTNQNMSPRGDMCTQHWMEEIPFSLLQFAARPIVGLLGGAIWTLGIGGIVSWTGIIVGTIATTITHYVVHFGEAANKSLSSTGHRTMLKFFTLAEIVPIVLSIAIGLTFGAIAGSPQGFAPYFIAVFFAMYSCDLIVAHMHGAFR